MLTLIKKIDTIYSEYICGCGNVKKIRTKDVRSKKTKSCGCLRKKNKPNFKHGLVGSKIQQTWKGMKERCLNKNSKSYEYYGGRGIFICLAWRESLTAFVIDVGHPPTMEHQLDRIDNDDGYHRENCRWVHRVMQMRNTNRNKFITYNGETKCLAEWGKEYGISSATMSRRFAKGLPPHKILFKGKLV